MVIKYIKRQKVTNMYVFYTYHKPVDFWYKCFRDCGCLDFHILELLSQAEKYIVNLNKFADKHLS